jgi:uncharacterized protein YkwD
MSLLILFCATLLSDGDLELKLSKDEQALVNLVNEARKKEKLPALTLNLVLCRVAQRHSQNMARQEKMSHKLDDKTPGQRLTDAGYEWSSSRENLAMAEGSKDIPASTPAEIHTKWMESKGHRANILDPKVTQIGIAIVVSKKGTFYYTQVFAAPQK